LLAAVGAALLFDPIGAPLLNVLGPSADRWIGGSILLALTGFVGWLSAAKRQLNLFGWRLPMPGGRSAVAQILIGAIDIAAACAALYLLLPADVAPSFVAFLIVFVVGILFSVISHAPGGLGVMEATILVGLGAVGRSDVLAALLVFRIVYYLLPLVLAAAAILVIEFRRARPSTTGSEATYPNWMQRVIAPASGVLVVICGLVLLISGNTPSENSRIDFLRDALPLPFAEASHMLASLIGLLLVVIAHGLFRRIALANTAAILLLTAGAVFSMLKGLDWEEALILLAVTAALFLFRDAFYRRGDWRSFRPGVGWLSLVSIVAVATTFVGILAFRHVEYSSQLWWDFAWSGDAPRFLRASLAISVVVCALSLDALINRPIQRRIHQVDVPEAVRNILAETDSTQPSVALLGDKDFIVSADKRAFLMYGVSGRSWISMGDPVGESDAARGLIWRFAEDADRAGGRAVFYAIGPEMISSYLDLGMGILKIGEVARVELKSFSLDGAARQDFRYADRKAEREGLDFEILPKSSVPEVLVDLKAVSDAWLATKHGHEKGFSLGRFENSYVREFDCAVMRKNGQIVAFANLWKGANLDEISVDLMRYRPGVSKILMDAFFARLLLRAKADGYHWFNLGAAPLSGLADHPLSSTWNRIGTFIYRRGDELYNFEGLRAFKQKFNPVWTPQYLACRGGFAIAHVLLDVAGLIAGGPVGIFRR
jgi:phosphatidylglycerol lysyltransferase